MTDELVTLLTVAAFIVAGVCAAVAIALWRERVLRRRVELETARALFKRHFEVASQLVDDPATPQSVREFILDFADVLNRPEMSSRVVDALTIEGSDEPVPDHIQAVFADVKALGAHRSDLLAQFYEFAMTGMHAVVLRADEDGFALPRTLAASPPTTRQQATIISRLSGSVAPGWCAHPA